MYQMSLLTWIFLPKDENLEINTPEISMLGWSEKKVIFNTFIR